VKKFRFKLQTLLEQRKSKEELLQVELGEIRREEAAELARLDDIQARLFEIMSERESLKVGKSEYYARFDEYAQALRDDVKVQSLTIEAVKERLEMKRTELVDAVKARKVIEALRDKQERNYLMALVRAEQGALDEMASLRYARGV